MMEVMTDKFLENELALPPVKEFFIDLVGETKIAWAFRRDSEDPEMYQCAGCESHVYRRLGEDNTSLRKHALYCAPKIVTERINIGRKKFW